MKVLELNQMEGLEGGKDCTNDGIAFMAGATLGGTLAGGPVGFMMGGFIGVIGGTFISIAKAC
jgi:hypothetical protein